VIQTPRPWSRGNEVEKDKTEHDRDFPKIVDGVKTSWEMHSKVADGHLTGNDNCGDSSKQSEQKQKSSRYFQHSSDSQQRKIRESCVWLTGWKTEKLLSAVLKEKQSGHNPKNTQEVWRQVR
jgi:hypothetical protein